MIQSEEEILRSQTYDQFQQTIGFQKKNVMIFSRMTQYQKRRWTIDLKNSANIGSKPKCTTPYDNKNASS